MRLLSYIHRQQASWGAARGEHVVDFAPASGLATLRSALAALDADALARLAQRDGPQVPLHEITYLPVIPDPARIVCAGLNYEDHRKESNRAATEHPTLFIRFPSSHVGHGQALVVPRESPQLDYEGEVAVVIGRGGRRIAERDAWDHVAGYSAYHDGSVRDWQMHTSQFIAGKNFDATGGFGPWLVTRDEIEDGAVLGLATRVNGQELQRSSTDHLIFSIPRLIHYISSFTPLEPGDVIATGTPSGVGFKRNPPIYLKPGDVVEVEVDRVGTLRHPVVAEATPPQ